MDDSKKPMQIASSGRMSKTDASSRERPKPQARQAERLTRALSRVSSREATHPGMRAETRSAVSKTTVTIHSCVVDLPERVLPRETTAKASQRVVCPRSLVEVRTGEKPAVQLAKITLVSASVAAMLLVVIAVVLTVPGQVVVTEVDSVVVEETEAASAEAAVIEEASAEAVVTEVEEAATEEAVEAVAASPKIIVDLEASEATTLAESDPIHTNYNSNISISKYFINYCIHSST